MIEFGYANYSIPYLFLGFAIKHIKFSAKLSSKLLVNIELTFKLLISLLLCTKIAIK